MTLEEALALEKKKPYRKKPREIEHEIQVMCVNWFRYHFPTLGKLLIAIPNGGRRDAVTGAKLKAEGVVAGASDLILLKRNKHYDYFCIEMKTPTGVQSKEQKEFEQAVRMSGGKYALCRSLDNFRDLINGYFNNER